MASVPHVARTMRTLLTTTAETAATADRGVCNAAPSSPARAWCRRWSWAGLGTPAATLQQFGPDGGTLGDHHYAPGPAPAVHGHDRWRAWRRSWPRP